MKYLDKYQITDTKLLQQFIEQPRTDFSINRYGTFLGERSQSLASAGNQMLVQLSDGLPDASRPGSNNTAEAESA